MKSAADSQVRYGIWILLLAALFTVFSLVIPALAAEQIGSLTLRCTVKKEGKTIPLSGDTYALVQIADAQVSVGGEIAYTIRPAYKAFDCDWPSLATSQLRTQAVALEAETRRHPEEWTTGVTDLKGTAQFSELPPGLYLVMRTAAAAQNSRYVSKPFLVSVPERVEDAVLYDVVSTPKFGWEEKPNPTPTPPNLPQTGQLWWPVPLLFLTGVEMIAIGLYLERKKSRMLSRDA